MCALDVGDFDPVAAAEGGGDLVDEEGARVWRRGGPGLQIHYK